MQIVQVISNLALGGAQQLALDLHGQYRAAGRDSSVLSLVESRRVAGREGVSSVCSSHRYSPTGIAKGIREVAKTLKSAEGPGVIHGHLFPVQALLGISRAISLQSHRWGWVFTEHSTWNRRRALMVGRLIDRIGYMSFDRIVCISEGVREALVESYPSTKNKSEVIYNGTDIPRYVDAVPVQVESEKGSTIVISVGILARRKNIDTALNALAWLESEQWEYWIVGDGPFRGELEELARMLGIRDRVRFWGYREDVPRLLKAADIFLLPSKWEGFGLAVVEAMAAGLPVIVGDVAGVREVVAAGEDGLLVDPNSVVDVAKKLSSLLKEPAARKVYSARARSAVGRFSIEQTAEEYMSLYQRVLDNKKK